MAGHTNITIYIDNKPYRFDVVINTETDLAKYGVRQDGSNGNHIDWLPDEFVITEEGRIESGEEINTVEQEQIVRLIWQGIKDALNVPS